MDKPNIFAYVDYRKYLTDMLEYRKSKDKKFSLIYFSKQIGLSGSYLKLVLRKKRRLNLDAALLLAKKIRCDQAEKTYLINLVLKNHSETPLLKSHFELNLADQKRQQISYNSNLKLNSVFSNSLMWEIFSLIGVDDFSDDARWIASRLKRRKPMISSIEECLNRLLKIGAVEYVDGKLKAKDIVSKHSIDLASVYSVALQRAIDHLQFRPDDKAYFDSFCLILSDQEYEQIREILEAAKRKMATVATRKGPKTRIAYYNANLFFASE